MATCTYQEDILHGKPCGQPAELRGYTVVTQGDWYYPDGPGGLAYFNFRIGDPEKLVPSFLCDRHHAMHQKNMAEIMATSNAKLAEDRTGK